ncbi:MAG TPA: hypothetical protein VM074_01770 [Solimonas sp.]|nr:hypothetical protein [Solimonas sp.]
MTISISRALRLGLLGAALGLAACGEYRVPGDAAPGSGATGAAAKNCDELFTQRVQPRLEFCRNCHVPGGVADVPDGQLFQLTSNRAEDFARLRTSWEALGRNDGGKSRILKMASGTDSRSHSGGTPWPVGSAGYQEMDAQLLGFVDPAACVLGGGGGGEDKPLLGSARGGHPWFDFCEGKPDATPVPEDPRELVVPGVNTGKAVYMNAFWQTCQADNHPANCGDLRARKARGYPLIASAGEVGAGSFFSGNSPDSSYAFPADLYNSMWQQIWQLDARPDNFDQLVAERWGMPLSPTRNPYPLPGEDPNATAGGSGQLPMGVTQLRNADGSWTGKLNVTCSICHGGQVGDASDGPGLGAMYGTNSLSDITVMFTDLARLAPQQGALSVISQNKVRGTGNITNFQLFGLLTITDPNGLPGYISIQAEPSTGTEDPPVWWNLGHRPAKFFDAGQVTDAKRIELSFHFPGTPSHGFPGTDTMADDKQWIVDHQQDGDAWIMSLRSPVWPAGRLGAIDTALAQQGAILFHSKDLWAPTLNNPVPRPDGGNGSCASCHGAYSPRYVNDPAYLDTPALEGVAAYIVPLEVIGTDSRRVDGNSQRVADAARTNWFAYSEGPYNDAGVSLCADWNDTALRGTRRLGYLAPPLYGVWATAPYFHNGAVPNAWEVLQPADRAPIWRRLSNEPRADQAGAVVMGYTASLATGYDVEKMGWKYEALACGTGSMPFIDCNPVLDDGATVQDALAFVWANGGLAWNLLNPPIMNDAMIEDRKVYNTHYYSQSNAGHAFTSVLTDQERRALIEYLKTL